VWLAAAIAAVVGGACVAALVLALRGRSSLAMASLFAGIAAGFLVAWPTVMRQTDSSTATALAIKKAGRAVPADAPLFCYKDEHRLLVYYTGRNVPRLVDSEAVQEQIAAGRPFYLVCFEGDGKPKQADSELELVLAEPHPRHRRDSLWLYAWPRKAD